MKDILIGLMILVYPLLLVAACIGMAYAIVAMVEGGWEGTSVYSSLSETISAFGDFLF